MEKKRGPRDVKHIIFGVAPMGQHPEIFMDLCAGAMILELTCSGKYCDGDIYTLQNLPASLLLI